jgi:hypothetical protein
VTAQQRALVIVGNGAASVIHAIENDIHAALRHIGVDSTIMMAADIGAMLKKLDPAVDFLVDCNHRNAIPAFRKFSFMGDHPCTRLKEMVGRHSGREVLGWVDATHVAAMTALGLPHASSFVPDAGPDPRPDPLPMRERDIDILFCGSLAEPVERAQWIADHPNWPEALSHIVFDAAEAIATTTEPAIDLFIRACAAHGVSVAEAFSRDVFCMLMTHVLQLAEMNRRVEVLSSLPDARIAIISNHLPLLLRDRPNIEFLGYIDDYDQVRDLMGRSKIVLDTTCKFPAGSHERIWYGMAQGAVLLTDRSSFVARDFRDREEILLLPKERIAPGALDDLRGLLDDAAGLQRIAGGAAVKYAAGHTWKQRITLVHDLVNGRVPATPALAGAA